MDLLAFEPSAERARNLDARVRERLGESLRHVVEQGGTLLPVPPAALEEFFRTLARGPVRAEVFSAYGDLIPAIHEDRLEEATTLLAEIVACPPAQPGLCVSDLADPEVDPPASRLRAMMAMEYPFQIEPPDETAARKGRRLLPEALATLAAADPEFAAELHALVREVILVGGPDPATGETLSGAAGLLLWGAILLNPSGTASVPEMVRALAHEGAHALLFGLAVDEPLLENPREPIHRSPLRRDPRPLEGVYHASYVLARMHRATRRLLQAGGLTASERSQVGLWLEEDRVGFVAGVETVAAEAQLTSLGRTVLDAACRYMRVDPLDA